MSIVADIDQFIVNRLSLIQVDGNPIPVLPYEPSRDKGHMIYPSATVTRVGFNEDTTRRRFGIETFTPSVEKKTIQLANGNVRIVPDHYVANPYPGIFSLRYIIDIEAVVKEHSDMMLFMMCQAFPFGFEPNISGQYVYFRFTKPINKDELYKPLFKLSYLFDVDGVRINRLESYNIAPMSEQLFDFSSVPKSPHTDALVDYENVYSVTTA